MPGIMSSSNTLEDYREAINTQDTHRKLRIADDLIEYLSGAFLVDGSPYQPQDACLLIDGLAAWVNSSNFKVSQKGLEILGIIASRAGSRMSKGHITAVLAIAVDRLGDSKQVVREHAMDLLFKFMDPVSSPQFVFDCLVQYFNHKNWRVREVLMLCLMKAINQFGASTIQLSKITPHLVKLLSDPTGQVRDTAVATMVEVYRHVGERFRSDIMKRNIPDQKLTGILSKFDKTTVQADASMDTSKKKCTSSQDITDGTDGKKKPLRSAPRRSASFAAGDKKKNVNERGVESSGAVDETDFISVWDEVPEPRFISARDISNELEKLKNILSNTNNDWEKRVDALRSLRSIVKVSGQVENFNKLMKDMENALRVSVKDLRSAVVREVCITLSYTSYIMENNFEYLAENLLPSLINLIPNSAKIMSSSGHAAMRLIIKNTATPRIIPIIVSSLLTSKSKDIRRRCADYLGLLLEVWSTSIIKSHVALIEEAIKKGISDADSEARAAVRRVYWHFADHYKSRAESMMQSFDSSKQKLLQSDKNLVSATAPPKSSKPTRTLSQLDLSEGKQKKPSRSKATNGEMYPPSVPQPSMQRSASQLEYKHKNVPSMTPRQKSYDDMKRNNRATPREGRPRYPQRGVASQPSSRTTSPKRIIPPTMTRERSEDYMKTYNNQRTKIPTPAKSTSQANSRQQSRDQSPERLHTSRSAFDSRMRHDNQADVTEDALWNALKKKGQRERCSSQSSINGPGSDESDTTNQSLNSSYKRNVSLDYDEIMKHLQHESPGARREGLLSLQGHLNSVKTLTTREARTIRDVFNRYFLEVNSKIYSLFLDVLSEFIVQYRHELQDWLFILLTRLLHRISSEVLPSAQTKIAMVLDVVRDSYPYDHQFQIITKYITDNSASPTIKMKVKLLQYLTGLISLMDASDFTNTVLIRLAVSRIVTWISEPKSPEVRKEATAVIIALFQLNSAEFSMLLSNVPNSIQEGATRVIQVRLKTSNVENAMANLSLANDSPFDGGNSEPMSWHESNSQYGNNSFSGSSPMRKGSDSDYYRKPPVEDYHVESPVKHARGQRANSLVGNDYVSPPNNFPSGNSTHDGSYDGTEQAEALQSTSTPLTNKFMEGTPKLQQNDIFGLPQVNTAPTPPISTTDTSYSNQWLSRDSPATYNPKQYEDSLIYAKNSPNNDTQLFNRIGDGAEHPDSNLPLEEKDKDILNLFNQISTVLCSPSSTESEDVKSALQELTKLIRAWDTQVVSPMLKVILPDVLAQLSHNEATIRCLSARSLREIASTHPESYRSNLNAFIVPLLNTEADSQKEVAKTAEECCTIVGQTIPADEIIPVISPVVGDPAYPVNVSAIKMLNVIVDNNCDKAILLKHLNIVVKNLLKAYDHSESSARKSAVFCLVSVHNLAGAEAVTPYFNDLAGSKFKLLNLYIRRSQSTNL